MHLADIMARRAVPGAGLLIALTSRCPLACAHCSTASTMTGPEPEAADLHRFIEGFTSRNRPDVTFFTGGEPLLRPKLLTELAGSARAAGSIPVVLTGAYFARGGRIPARVRAALLTMGHVSISLDAFHEREVPRTDVFAVLRDLLRLGHSVSLHLTGTEAYLAPTTAEVHRRFGADVPMLVSDLQAVGRAAAWRQARPETQVATKTPLSPCALAAWPVLAADGAVTACCSPATLDRRPVPRHLLLGTLGRDDWETVRSRLLASPMLRGVRVLGPDHLAARFAEPGDAPDASGRGGVCGRCHALSDRADRADRVDRVDGVDRAKKTGPVGAPVVLGAFAGPAGALLDRGAADRQRRAGAVALLKRYGAPRYAHLIEPGGPAATGAKP